MSVPDEPPPLSGQLQLAVRDTVNPSIESVDGDISEINLRNNNNFNSSLTLVNVNENQFKKPKIDFNEKLKYKDVWAIILFVCTIIITIVIACISLPHINLGKVVNYNSKYHDDYKECIMFIIVSGIISIIGSAILTLIYMLLVKYCGEKMIKGTLFFSLIFYLIHISWCIIIPYIYIYPFKLFYVIIFSVLIISSYFIWKSKIPLAKDILKTVNSVIRRNPDIFKIGFIGCAIACIWYIFLSFAMFATISYSNEKGKGVIYLCIIYIFFLFSFYYSSQVIKNIVHVTTAGIFATYYLHGVIDPISNKVEVDNRSITLKSLKRAITTSFGPICYGSLTIPIIKIFEWIVQNSCCCFKCIHPCIYHLKKYFNEYAFTNVFIYGESYREAAKNTWTVFKEHGFEKLIKDNIIDKVLNLGAVTVVFSFMETNLFLGLFLINNKWYSFLAVYLIASALISVMVFSIFAEIIKSGVATTIVCLCEDSETMHQNQLEFWEKIKDSYPTLTI